MMQEIPSFHHIHLNSTNPDAAIAFYLHQFKNTEKTQWGGLPALKSFNDVLIIFNTVSTPAPTAPQSAIWHFGWYVTDVRARMQTFKNRSEVTLLPLYTGEAEEAVFINTDTYPGVDGVLGLTQAQLQDARQKGVQPKGGPGFAYMQGPDGAIVEYMGDFSVERFNHIHLYQEDPFCAQIWYQRHLNAPVMPGRVSPTPMTEKTCHVERGASRTWPALNREGMFRSPRAAVLFGDVALTWYPPQDDQPLVSSRGQLYDHFGLGVKDLTGWAKKLKNEGVHFLSDIEVINETRSLMIEGPSREAIELVEV